MSSYNYLRAFVRRHKSLDGLIQRTKIRWLANGPGYPNFAEKKRSSPDAWQKIVDASAGKDRARVLIATSIGAHLAAMQMETVLAASLRARGAQVEALLCDRLLPGCQMCEPRFIPDAAEMAKYGPQKAICGSCYAPGKRIFEELDIWVNAYSAWLTDDDKLRAREVALEVDLTTIDNFKYEGLSIGEHAKAGALRYYARATIDEEPHAEPILRRYIEAAMLAALSTRALLLARRFDVVVLHHGIYVPQGLIADVARTMGVRVVTWHPAYRRDCFIFSHDDTYHHTLMNEPTDAWERMIWDDNRKEVISSYLRSRWQGSNDWIKFVDDPSTGREQILDEIGLDPSKPIISCLTNVMWDAQLHYPANAFPNMLEWLLYTVNYFANRPDLQLVIRVHPAEIRGSVPSRQPVVAELAKHFPNLPKNVFVVGPESAISTYVLAELSDSVLIYGTKTGVELTSVGIPVIVAGEAWIRGKGIATDAASVDGYREALDALPLGKRLSNERRARALRYAYHFFYRRMIPVELFEQRSGHWPAYHFDATMGKLLPGRDAGLDLICSGILAGTPFVYDPAEICQVGDVGE